MIRTTSAYSPVFSTEAVRIWPLLENSGTYDGENLSIHNYYRVSNNTGSLTMLSNIFFQFNHFQTENVFTLKSKQFLSKFSAKPFLMKLRNRSDGNLCTDRSPGPTIGFWPIGSWYYEPILWNLPNRIPLRSKQSLSENASKW